MPIQGISTEGSLLYYLTIIAGALITGFFMVMQNRRNPPKEEPKESPPQEYRFIMDGTQGVLSIEEWMQNLVAIPIIVTSLELHLVTKYKDITIKVVDQKVTATKEASPDIS